MKAEKGRHNSADFDLRVRERSVAKGAIDAKGIERHLAELPDLESQVENVLVEQPALGEVEDLDVLPRNSSAVGSA